MKILNYPKNFDYSEFPKNFTVFSNGSYHLPLEDFKTTGQVMYVDVNTGNDNNPGTYNLPLQSVITAYKRNANIIYIAPGRYLRSHYLDLYCIERDISLLQWKKNPGKVELIAAQPLEWTAYQHIWQANRTNVHSVIDAKNIIKNGYYNTLLYAKTLDEVLNTENTWTSINGVVYVNLFNATIPDENTWAMIGHNLYAKGNVKVYLEGLTFIGGTNAVWIESLSITDKPLLVAKDCTFAYSQQNGLASRGAKTYLENCIAENNSYDGFNYHEKFNQAIALELNCIGRHNGHKTTGADQGSTQHESCRIVRVSGQYYSNRSQNIADVDCSHAWLVNCVSSDSPIGFRAQGNLTRMWLDNCVSMDAVQASSEYGAVVFNDNLTNTKETNNGMIINKICADCGFGALADSGFCVAT